MTNRGVVRGVWGVGMLFLAACGREAARADASPTPHAPQPVPFVPEFRLTEYGGRVFDLADQRGNVVLLFFGYTHCPDVCPTTMADFQGVAHRLGDRASRVKFVFISVDPKRDSPEVAASYARGFNRDFVGLSGDSSQIADVEKAFHTASYVEKDSTGQYSVAHSASVYVIGKDGSVTETLRFAGPQEETLYAMTDSLLNVQGPVQLAPRDAWIRTHTDVHTPAAAYVSLDNPGGTPITLRGASCPGVHSVTIHVSADSAGMSRMSSLDALLIPPRTGVTMSPGGIHLMLEGLSRPLRSGASLACTLHTSTGDVPVSIPIRDR